MILTSRDLRLLKAIDRYGLLTTRQIHGICFVGVAVRTMLRRLRHLKKKKIIIPHTGLSGGQLVWTLGLKGLQHVGSSTSITINKNTLEHDAQVSQVRIALDRAGLGTNWNSYHVLRAQASENNSPESRLTEQIPDALFAVETSRGIKIVALEVELVAKSKRRYRKIVEHYGDKRAIDFVWYVVSHPRLGKLVQEQAQMHCSSSDQYKFVYSSIEDVTAIPQTASAHFIGRSGKLGQLWVFKKPMNRQVPKDGMPTPQPTV
jgi:hypothetical protein